LKKPRVEKSPSPALLEIAEVRIRLAEAEEALRAIRAGEVDAVVVAGKHGTQVFTLEGAEHDYRVLIESINEGALILTADKTILYANQCFARMVHCPLEQVTGGSLRRFLSPEDRARIRPLLRRSLKAGFKMQMVLHGGDGSRLPVHVSVRPLEGAGSGKLKDEATLSMVVTDMTEAKRVEELLRALTHKVVQAQESERERVAHELHDTITQTLCGILVHSQVLANGLPAGGGAVGLTSKAGGAESFRHDRTHRRRGGAHFPKPPSQRARQSRFGRGLAGHQRGIHGPHGRARQGQVRGTVTASPGQYRVGALPYSSGNPEKHREACACPPRYGTPHEGKDRDTVAGPR
jgi:PAS domain S-box-containing protein